MFGYVLQLCKGGRIRSHLPDLGHTLKKLTNSMLCGVVDGASFAPRQRLKKCANARRISMCAKCIPRHVRDPAPKGM